MSYSEAKTAKLAHSENHTYKDGKWQPRTKQDSTDRVLSQAPHLDIHVPNLDVEPYSFQKATIGYCLRNKRVIVGEPTGSGKTISAISVMAATQSFPAVVVAPKTLLPMWRGEIQRVARDVVDSIQVLEGANDVVRGSDVTIVNYGLLSYDGYEQSFDLTRDLSILDPEIVISDEGHATRGESLRSLAVEQIASDSKYCLLLTGSPVVRDTDDLKRMCEILGKDVDLDGSPEEINKRLRDKCYVRHERNVILRDLPDRRRKKVNVSISNREHYDSLRRKHRHDLSEKTGFKNLFRFRRAAAIGKLDYAEDLVSSFDEPAVCYAIHRDVQESLIERFPSAARVVSDLSMDRRGEEVKRFQEGETDVLICAIGNTPEQSPGGVGIELTRAKHGVFCELGWTHSHMMQAGNRIHRMGQDQPVSLWFLVAKNTIDEKIWDLIESRRYSTKRSTEGVTDPHEILESLL